LVRQAAFQTLPIPLAETILANHLWSSAGGKPAAGPVTLAPDPDIQFFNVSGPLCSTILSGRAERVPWGQQADHVLLVARDAGDRFRLCLVPVESAKVIPARNLAYEPRDTLAYDKLALPGGSVRDIPAALACSVWIQGAALRSQQMIGAMQRCLSYALSYANERVQFGRPIAKFQAVQHMLAIAAGHLAAATAAADALFEADSDSRFEFACATAKARTGEAAGLIASICHQVHGAIGFTQEHPLHFATRRLWSWRDEFGSESYWQARIGRLVCRLGGEALWPLVTCEHEDTLTV
jgi:acyl-CoA dehydrogenase